MKKRSQAYLARKAAKRKAAQEARQQALPRSEQSPKEHPRWIRVAKWIVGTAIFGGVSFVASVYQIWGGPPWPVPPSFAPGFPSSAFALDVPFTVTNKSALFSIKHMQISCGLGHVRTSNNMIFKNLGVMFNGGGSFTLEPQRSATYTCPFTGVIGLPKGATILSATISFITKYDSLLSFGGRAEAESESFTLNTQTIPPQWTVGKPLQ